MRGAGQASVIAALAAAFRRSATRSPAAAPELEDGEKGETEEEKKGEQEGQEEEVSEEKEEETKEGNEESGLNPAAEAGEKSRRYSCSPMAHPPLQALSYNTGGAEPDGGRVRASIAGWLATIEIGGRGHWRDCHFAGALSPSLLKHLLKVEGVAAE